MYNQTTIYDHQLRLATMDTDFVRMACKLHTDLHISIDPLNFADNMLAFHIESEQVDFQIVEASQRAEDKLYDDLWNSTQLQDDYINDEHLLTLS